MSWQPRQQAGTGGQELLQRRLLLLLPPMSTAAQRMQQALRWLLAPALLQPQCPRLAAVSSLERLTDKDGRLLTMILLKQQKQVETDGV